MNAFLALITPLGGFPPSGPPLGTWGGSSPGVMPQPYPDQGLPGNQPYPDQGLPRPPLGTWGGRPPNYVDIGGPGPQPRPDQGLPGNQPYPDQGLPGQQPRPWGPIFYPDQGLPGPQPGPSHPWIPGGNYPPVIWDPARPTNPIVNPGDPNNPGAGQGEQGQRIEWKTAWSPTTGWIVVGVPTGPTPTPSQEPSQE